MDTLKSFPYLTVMWDDDSHSVICQWKGGFLNRNIKEGLDSGLEEFKKRLPKAHWIGDTSDIGVITEEEKKWIDTDWFPRFLGTGAKFMAVVQPSSVVAKLSVKSTMSKVAGTDLTVYNCVTLKEAQEWMKKQGF